VVRLLEAVAAHDQGIGVRELGRETAIDKSAVSRLLSQLQEMNMVEQSEVSGRFEIGARFYALASTIHGRDTLWRAAEPVLRDLAGRFNETCYLATRERDQIVFREKVDCDRTIRYVIELGQSSPLHAGAGGRAILAGMSPAESDAVIAKSELTAITSGTITDPAELRRQIAEDRRRGFSISTGERVVGGSAIAAPYYRAGGICHGSLVFTCPAIRFDVRLAPEIADAVVDAARQLSARLGHTAAPQASA
jgi:IclR family acetate operon transcriptional repressor